MRLKIREGNGKGVYNLNKILSHAIMYDEEKRVAYSLNMNEAVAFTEPENKRGGIIVFSEEINAVELSKNKIIDWIKQKVSTLKNKLTGKKRIDVIADNYDLVGWTIGNYFDGRYKAKNGKFYGEDSLSLEIIGVDTDTLVNIATDVCKEFQQELVLVKDYSTNTVMFVDPT